MELRGLRVISKIIMKKETNITEYSYKEGHKFDGFRVCKNSHGRSFQKYYSVKKYGSKTKALKAAKKARKAATDILNTATLYRGKLSKKTISDVSVAMVINPSQVK